MKTFAIAGVAGLTVCQLASAASFTSVVGGSAWGGQNYINFDSSVAGANGVFSPAAGVTVTLTPDAQLVSGSVSGAYAAPYLSGDNNKYFEGSTPEGPDGTRYLTTGSTGPYPGASITFTFTTPQHYFGLLWGSIDAYNTLNIALDTITGAQVIHPSNGDQGLNGTAYVNIWSADSFTTVTLSSSEYAFELDNVAFGVPDSGVTVMLLGMGLMGLGAIRRKLS